MYNIEVKVLNVGHDQPANMMMFLAGLTQRGHSISSMDELTAFYDSCMAKEYKTAKHIAQQMERHGTIKRFAPVTVAIVGASRRFLAQMRTHHIGVEWVSGSLQYSDYSNIDKMFVVPYSVIEKDTTDPSNWSSTWHQDKFLQDCEKGLEQYKHYAAMYDNDTAGYLMPPALKNILICQASAEAWSNMIQVRSCRRNTPETAIVAIKIWDALHKSTDGDIFYENIGPDCTTRGCREGSMTCKKPCKTKTPLSLMLEMYPLMLCKDRLEFASSFEEALKPWQ